MFQSSPNWQRRRWRVLLWRWGIPPRKQGSGGVKWPEMWGSKQPNRHLIDHWWGGCRMLLLSHLLNLPHYFVLCQSNGDWGGKGKRIRERERHKKNKESRKWAKRKEKEKKVKGNCHHTWDEILGGETEIWIVVRLVLELNFERGIWKEGEKKVKRRRKKRAWKAPTIP